MPSSGYTAITFVANEQPTTAKWNLIGSNDASFNNGNGFEDGILVNRHFAAGAVTPDKMTVNTATGNTLRTSTFSTSSASPVNITGGNLSQTLTTKGGKVLVIFYMTAYVNTNTAQLYLTVDGGTPTPVFQFSSTASKAYCIPVVLSGIAAGAHTIAAQVSIPGGAVFSVAIYETQGMIVQEIGM